MRGVLSDGGEGRTEGEAIADVIESGAGGATNAPTPGRSMSPT